MFKKAGIITFLFPVISYAQVKIAVIDSGLNIYSGAKICSTGHYDFVANKSWVGIDRIGHGTGIVKIINEFANNKNYCLLIYKVFDPQIGDANNVVAAIARARANRAKYYNLSFNGVYSNTNEYMQLKLALKEGAKIIVASGNERLNLDKKCISFPACYKLPMIVVGSYDDTRANYGKVVTIKETFCHKQFCGTSVSAAIVTGKLIKDINESKLRKNY